MNRPDQPHNDSSPLQPKRREALPEPTLRRLPWYLAYLTMLKANGIEHVSSTTISKTIGVDPSLIAKDLSFLAAKGRPGVGYEVAALENTLNDFLGFTRRHNAVMLGVGSLGSALIADSGLARYGLNIVAGFDSSPLVVGKEICGIKVYHISALEEMLPKLNAGIAVIAVPVENAQAVADKAVEAGVKALWNFTPYRIRTRNDIVIQNTSIYSHLAVMYNRLEAAAPRIP